MRVLLDENLPHQMRFELSGHDVSTAAYMGWSGVENGELLTLAAAAGFDALVTNDRGIEFQHNLDELPLAVVVVLAASNTIEAIRPAYAELLAVLAGPAADYLPVLLSAFRSPWEPAADLAADALIALAPPTAIPELIGFLDGRHADGLAPPIRELVRVNHHRNCLLCHAQSVSRGDGVRVAVPNPARALPPSFSLDTYEGGGRGGSQTPRGTVFARPDITYLQQDFSWMLPVAAPGRWPTLQRYDFVIRTRPTVAREQAAVAPDSPQRRAVVRALQSLTGKYFGDRADDWRAGLASAKRAE